MFSIQAQFILIISRFRILAEIASLSSISAIKVKQLAVKVRLADLPITTKAVFRRQKCSPAAAVRLRVLRD